MNTSSGHPPRPPTARRDGVVMRTATLSTTTGVALDDAVDAFDPR
jgi:hypothetical protein